MSTRVVIAGGGTGGHLYPGIALAKALMEHDNTIEITFVGTERGLESRVLPREGFALKTISSGGLVGKRGLSRLISFAKLPLGVLQALGFLIRQRPALAVGVGGYVSGPLLAAACLLRIPTLIHEQNAFPGVTNRLLGNRVDRICISFEESAQFFPKETTTLTGNMIRKSFADAKEPTQRDANAPLNILILGGSQGARSINKAVVDALPLLEAEKKKLRFVHQTGESEAEKVNAAYKEQGWNAEVAPFIFDMETRYREADLVICRAGATTLAELTALGRPGVLVPFPFATHNHQEKNARVLESANAAVLVLDKEADGTRIAELIESALSDVDQWHARAIASFKLGKRDATDRVKNLCLDSINRKAA